MYKLIKQITESSFAIVCLDFTHLWPEQLRSYTDNKWRQPWTLFLKWLLYVTDKISMFCVKVNFFLLNKRFLKISPRADIIAWCIFKQFFLCVLEKIRGFFLIFAFEVLICIPCVGLVIKLHHDDYCSLFYVSVCVEYCWRSSNLWVLLDLLFLSCLLIYCYFRSAKMQV